MAGEADAVFAHLNVVATAQLLALDRLAIDVRPVGAVEVFQEHIHAQHLEHGMFTADGQVVDDDVVIGPAAQCRALLGELHFLDHHSVDRHNYFCHERLLLR